MVLEGFDKIGFLFEYKAKEEIGQKKQLCKVFYYVI